MHKATSLTLASQCRLQAAVYSRQAKLAERLTASFVLTWVTLLFTVGGKVKVHSTQLISGFTNHNTNSEHT